MNRQDCIADNFMMQQTIPLHSRRRLWEFYLSLVLCFVTTFSVGAQTRESISPQATVLKPHQPISVSLKAGQVDRYIVSLRAGQFASIKIRQESVGVGYFVYAPNNHLIRNEDLSAISQSEVITIDALQSGAYRIEVFWDYNRPQFGKYTIVMENLTSAGKTPAAKAARLMDSWYNDKEPGAAVAVVQNGRVIYQRTKGVANLEYNLPITNTSSFELASNSKQFTGFAIAMLINQGRISLDDDIRKYLPEVPDFGRKILLRHLVYHTSGLLNWDLATYAMGYRNDDIVTMEMVMKMVAHQKQLNFSPGDMFAYSNTGYNLLAKVVEKVSGTAFSGWMKDKLFTPLGMKNTHIQDDIRKIIPRKVSSYKASDQGFHLYPNTFSVFGSTCVQASLDDLVRWVNNLETGRVGGKGVLDILKREDTLNNGEKLPGGFGNFPGTYQGIQKIEHLGLVLGYRTAITRYPEQGLAVIYLSNDSNDATFARASQLAEVFLKNLKTEPLKATPFPDLSQALESTKPVRMERPAQDLTEFAGLYYAEGLNVIYKIILVDGVLVLDFPRVEASYLHPDKSDTFSISLQATPHRLEFQRDGNGNITGFVISSSQARVFFSKLR